MERLKTLNGSISNGSTEEFQREKFTAKVISNRKQLFDNKLLI